MRLFLLVSLTMAAFAANSLLTRVAVESGAADPGAFAVIRVATGAIALVLLVRAKGQTVPLRAKDRMWGAATLSLYMVGFSLAYRTLDAGLGALVLFGVVQISMFAYAASRGPIGSRRAIGAGTAFAGLSWVLWPTGGAAPDPTGAVLMALAGLGWGGYSLLGRKEPAALAATAANFCIALPITGIVLMFAGQEMALPTLSGWLLAATSGAITSGLGYALWYSLLPRLSPTVAATVQLSVPIIALVAGAMLLGEIIGPRLIVGAILVVGGIALAVTGQNRSRL
ncbi:DMT family transporter [Primorskyibacter sp. S87]|uniref:DMT family transporter n=1 Tax=Primorskyibacter sp. S87 TaxID=3415126 RepID=UPI003C7C20A5